MMTWSKYMRGYSERVRANQAVNTLDKEPLVSVIIPTFNRAALIRRAIESVLRQTYATFEILVADDASTDNTSSVVSAVGDSRIRYLKSEINAGASAARNRGLAAAKGEFVAFLDSDDVWMPDKLELQMAAMAQCSDPAAVVCYTQLVVDSGSAQTLMPTRAKRRTEPVGDYVLGHEGLIHTSSLLLSRQLAETTPFPVGQKKHEDWDVFLRLEERKVGWLFIDRPLAVWHNEPRPGRLTNLSYHPSLKWLKEHESMLSARARSGFMLKEVATPLIRSEQRRAYAFWLILAAVMYGAVGPADGLRAMARAALPKSVRLKAKKLLKPSTAPRR